MKVLILGGDGYIGWPMAMYFSARGHEVTVVDNYFRRTACLSVDVRPLYELPTLVERARVWRERTGRSIAVVIADLSDPARMRSLFDGSAGCAWSAGDAPDVIVHFAEQPSAPYSMLSHEAADLTVVNNLRVTNNLLWAVKTYCPSSHIIKLGTMGEYGTPNIDIEEGWIDIEHKGRSDRFLFPRQASSLYHTTKIMDTDLIWFAVRMWDLRVTDLMQGPVYGIETEETRLDPRLRTIFNYDELFGTVVNRFVVQAVIGYPLTVYGKGGQTRGYLNLMDSLQCIDIAAGHPPEPGSLEIYNQITETFSVRELADLVVEAARGKGLDVRIESIENPRQELEEHYYNPTYTALLERGLKPNFLNVEVLGEMLDVVMENKQNIREDIVFRGVKW